MTYKYYTYKSADELKAFLIESQKRYNWDAMFNWGLRIKIEKDGSFLLSTGLLRSWAILYWFRAVINEQKALTTVTLNFHIFPTLLILPIFQCLFVLFALAHSIFYAGKAEEVLAAFVLFGMVLLEVYVIYLDKNRIRKSIIEFLGLIEGEV